MATTVLVTGASGTLGTSLRKRRDARQYRVRGMSRRPQSLRAASDATEWVRADLDTGEGLEAALAGVDVVIHAASAPRGDTERTDVRGTERLVSTARQAGVRHLIYVSIVGIDQIPLGYYRHKLAAESVVQGGGVPSTILRGTQFHDFMDSLVRRMARLPIALAPAGFLVQPIHVDEFADELWGCVADAARGRAPDVAGPEVLTYADMVRAWLSARGARRPVFSLPIPGKIASAMRHGAATAPERAVGRRTWREWLVMKYG
jgi:uncharacterized protein YbjT (DUF2867 family)